MSDIFVPGVSKPEEDYLELRRLGTKLGIPTPEMFLKVEYTPPEGDTETVYDGRSRTYVRNFWVAAFSANAPIFSTGGNSTYCGDGLATIHGQGTSISYTTNNASGPPGFGGFSDVSATVGNASNGIVIGRGIRPETFDDACLGVKIQHGTSSGQMTYNAQVSTGASYNSSTNTWSISSSRIFNNNSGATIPVTETGIYGTYYNSTGSGVISAMICRDLLGTPINVANGGAITITYSWAMTFPAATSNLTSPFSDVKMIIGNENGTNGTSTFLDQSSYNRTISAVGVAPTWSNTTAPTNVTTTIKLINTGGLQIVGSEDLHLGDLNWEISFLYYSSQTTHTGTTSGDMILTKKANTTSYAPFQIFWDPGNSQVIKIAGSSNGTSWDWIPETTITSSFIAATWYYFVFSKQYGTLHYKITSLAGSVLSLNSIALSGTGFPPIENSSPWTIGCNADGSKYLAGTNYISNFRFTLGNARKPGSNIIAVGGHYSDPNTLPNSWTLPLSTSV